MNCTPHKVDVEKSAEFQSAPHKSVDDPTVNVATVPDNPVGSVAALTCLVLPYRIPFLSNCTEINASAALPVYFASKTTLMPLIAVLGGIAVNGNAVAFS